jgi:hypothetical protein
MTIRAGQDGIAHLILRSVGPSSVRLTIPYEFKREHDLGAGDHVVWTPQPDGTVQLRFVKTHFEEVSEDEMAEAS